MLSTGSLDFLIADDQKGLLGYSRKDEENEIVVYFNRSDREQSFIADEVKGNSWSDLFILGKAEQKRGENGAEIILGPLSAIVIKR